MELLKRKIDKYLLDWKNTPKRKPLIVKGARQIGKTESATSLKSFCQDGRYDVICSGSLMGIYYEEIESNAVGFKDDFDMFSMDFEEFLWAKGYRPEQIEDMYRHMVALKPFSQLEMDAIMDVFRDYMSLGGMPEVVKMYIDNGHFGGTLELQRQLLKDYEEDITKYAKQTDKAKLLAVYNHISTFLAKDNKKYQITKIAKGARNREYVGAIDWLKKAGVINVCYCLNNVELPLKGNYMADYYKLYYYENIVGEMLRKSGYEQLYFYKHDNPALEMDFFVRDANSLVPVEVKAASKRAQSQACLSFAEREQARQTAKAKDNATASLNNLIKWDSYPDVKYGIKLGYKNIGWNGQFYTFPYFLTFLLKRFLKERESGNK